ncbi:hypothetical protein MRY87_12700 [bacterium]|nr:hypothetical protein [bacterium]
MNFLLATFLLFSWYTDRLIDSEPLVTKSLTQSDTAITTRNPKSRADRIGICTANAEGSEFGNSTLGCGGCTYDGGDWYSLAFYNDELRDNGNIAANAPTLIALNDGLRMGFLTYTINPLPGNCVLNTDSAQCETEYPCLYNVTFQVDFPQGPAGAAKTIKVRYKDPFTQQNVVVEESGADAEAPISFTTGAGNCGEKSNFTVLPKYGENGTFLHPESNLWAMLVGFDVYCSTCYQETGTGGTGE